MLAGNAAGSAKCRHHASSPLALYPFVAGARFNALNSVISAPYGITVQMGALPGAGHVCRDDRGILALFLCQPRAAISTPCR